MKNKIILLLVVSLIGGSALYLLTREHDEHEGHDHNTHEKAEVEKHDDHDDDDDHDEEVEEDNHDGHGHEGGGKAIGKGKAIEEVDETKGFKLSNEAIKTLNLKLKAVKQLKLEIPREALVASKDTNAVYIYRNGFFKMHPVRVLVKKAQSYTVLLSKTIFGDQVVTAGVPLLRVSDIYSTDTSEYGHGH